MAAVEKQTHFLLCTPVAPHGNGHGMRHSGDGLAIPAARLLAPGHGGHFLWDRSHRRHDPGGGVTEASPGYLDRFASRPAKSAHAFCWVAVDLSADIPIGQGHGRV